MAGYIVVVIITREENWPSMANYVEWILKLKERYWGCRTCRRAIIGDTVRYETGTWAKGIGETLQCFLNFRQAIQAGT